MHIYMKKKKFSQILHSIFVLDSWSMGSLVSASSIARSSSTDCLSMRKEYVLSNKNYFSNYKVIAEI